jgi:hypothetical protein
MLVNIYNRKDIMLPEDINTEHQCWAARYVYYLCKRKDD